MNERQAALVARLEAALDEPCAPIEAAARIKAPLPAARAAAKLGLAAGRLVELRGAWASRAWAAGKAAELRGAFGARQFKPRELREAFGLSRSEADALAGAIESIGALSRAEGGWRIAPAEPSEPQA